MKKVVIVLIVCFAVILALTGCSSVQSQQIVQNGAALCREDFNLYKDGKVVKDTDVTSKVSNWVNILVILPDEGSTARGIAVDKSLEDVQKAYAGCPGQKLTDERYPDRCTLVYTWSGYGLRLAITKDKVVSIQLNNPAYEKVQEDTDTITKTLTEPIK